MLASIGRSMQMAHARSTLALGREAAEERAGAGGAAATATGPPPPLAVAGLLSPAVAALIAFWIFF